MGPTRSLADVGPMCQEWSGRWLGACLASIGFSVIAYDLAVVTRDHGLSGLWVAHLPASQICAQIWFLGFYKAWYDFAYYTLNTIQLSYTILFVAISFVNCEVY